MKKIIMFFLFSCFFCFNVLDVHAEIVPFPKPNVNVSPNFNAIDGNNALKLVESSEIQGAILEKIEGGAEYGMSQKGYIPNPILEGTAVVYNVYQALSALYGEDPEYQVFIQPYKDMDNGGIFGEAWGQIFPVNTIYGTFVYGEIRLDVAIDSATGDILACYLSFQDGFEQTVDNLLSKLNNNFYCPVAPPAECEEYGLTQLAPVPDYSMEFYGDGNPSYIYYSRPTSDDLNSFSENHFVCYLKDTTDSLVTRRLLLVTSGEAYPYTNIGSVHGWTQWGGSYALEPMLLDINNYNIYSLMGFKLVAQSGQYNFYLAGDSFSHNLSERALKYYYNFSYCSYSMSVDDFVAYYVDNAGEMSVGGIAFTPVQPSSQAFPQPGNVYNPADLQDYNENQRKKIEECPVINPESEPYPGSEPAPGVEPEKRTLPQIMPDPATGAITVLPSPVPDPDSGGEPVIDPETGEKNDNGDLAPYMFDLSKKFPFCVPFDLINCVKILKQKPSAPSFEWTLKVDMINFEYTFHIDLACFEPAAKVCRIMFTLLFIVSLVVITRNMIRG